MEKGKVVGILTSSIGENSALLEVIAFQQAGHWITDKKVIKSAFPPEEKVYAPGFYYRPGSTEFKIGSCLEFLVEESPTAGASERNAEFQIHSSAKFYPKWSVFPCTIDLLDDFGAIHVANLQNTLVDIEQSHIEVSPTFYLDYQQKIYGPFKDKREQGSRILPKSGKMVRCWPKAACKLVSAGTEAYLLEQPDDEKGEEIDCITPDQLISWLDTKIRPFLDIRPYKSQLLKLIDESGQESFQKARIEKFIDIFQQQDHSLEFLQQFAETVPKLAQVFEKQLEAYKEELLAAKQEEIDKTLTDLEATFDQSRAELDSKQKKVSQEIGDMSEQYDSLLKHLDDLEKEIADLEESRDRLIKDFRLLLPALPTQLPSSMAAAEPLPSYSINRYRASSENKMGKETFLAQLQALLEATGLENAKKYCERTIKLMDSHRIIFAPHMQIPLAIANAGGHADCFIQQVEPNWLTYHHFRKAVFDPVLDQCQAHPDRFIFLILQDINLASPSCYARPFLEVHAGIRQTFPGSDSGWPSNLWTFLLVAAPDLGLPMDPDTFVACAGLPNKVPETLHLASAKSSATEQLPVDIFSPPEPTASAYINPYFDE